MKGMKRKEKQELFTIFSLICFLEIFSLDLESKGVILALSSYDFTKTCENPLRKLK